MFTNFFKKSKIDQISRFWNGTELKYTQGVSSEPYEMSYIITIQVKNKM